jgi:parvulin-like peptidyl-prolyl isomerase
MKKRLLIIAVLVMGLLLAGCNSGDKAKSKTIGEVNGDQITQTEFDQHFKLLKFSYETQVLGSAKLDENKDKDVISGLKDQSFKEMVIQKLVWQDTAKKNIKLSDKEFEDYLKDQDYKQFLEESGMDEKYFRQEMKTQMLYWKLHDNVTDKIKVTDEEAEKNYEENISQYTEPGGIQISHILVDSEEQARDILAKLESGSDFAELAKEHSSCPSKEQGGELGPVNEDSNLVTEFKDAALKLQPGEITKEPVKTQYGYHIIKAGDKKEPRTMTFDEVKDTVLANLEYEKKYKAYIEYLDELHEKAEIKDLRK